MNIIDAYETARQIRRHADREHIGEWARIGGHVRARREAQGWTQTELASLAGCDKTTISKLETGKLPVGIILLKKLDAILSTVNND